MKRKQQKEESEPTIKKIQAPVIARIETPEGYTSILVDEEGHEEVKRMLADISDQNQELLDAMNKLVNQMEENIKKRILEVEKRLNAKIENIAESAGIIINTTTQLFETVTQDHVNITDKLDQISYHVLASTPNEDIQEDAEPAKKTTAARGKKATAARK